MTDNAPVRRRLVDEALYDFLVAQLADTPVGLAALPNGVDFEDPNRRYIVLSPTAGVGQAIGPPSATESDVECDYDVRACAGLGRGQQGAQWLVDEVRRVLFTRTAWGAPVNTLTIEKHEEMDRSAIGGTPAATLTGDEWQATDQIRITVTRSS
jgi:hypothetical protein